MQDLQRFRSISWLVGLALVCLLASMLPTARPARAAGPITVELVSIADARVQGGGGIGGFGGGYIWTGTPDGHLAYVQFDLLALPADAVISSAELRLTFQGTYDGAANIELGRNDSAWDEATVTWDTKPTTSFSGLTRPVADEPATLSWPVTPLAQNWHAGSQPNYGLALRGDGVLKAFHSRETSVTDPPKLVITYSTPPDVQPRPDLGDAPDSSNNLGVNPNTAYVGVAGNFPTVWASTPAGDPAGPRHANQGREGLLGDALSREVEADSGNDADGLNNILNGGADNADNDRGDDGWRNRNIIFRNCVSTTLRIRVSKAQNAQLERMFLNIWFDGNRDGDWADRQLCRPENDALAIPAHEWIVQDYFVDMSGIPAGGFVDIDVPTVTVLNTTPGERHWMRFTLSEERVPQSQTGRADGRGPHPNSAPTGYRFGETEDVLQRPPLPGEDGSLELTKRVITNGEPVEWLDLVTYEIRLRHNGGTQPIEAAIRDALPYPLALYPTVDLNGVRYITVESPNGGAAPLVGQLDSTPPSGSNPPQQIVKWQGTLAPDSAVILTFKVRVMTLCGANEQTQTIVNRAEARPRSGDLISAEQSFVAKCLGYDGENVTFTPLPIDDLLDLNELHELPWNAEVVNSHPFSVTIGLYQPGAAQITTDPANLLGTLDLAPNQRRPLNLTLDLGQGDNELELPSTPTITANVSFCYILPGSAACPDPEQYPGMHSAAPPVIFTPRPNDLGDAPDSTNHAGAAMSAYPGVPASFPTVFDPATGLPQGPKHAFPRPFHLGERVSREAEADVGPDQDPTNNILPAANTPNLDRFDDGARLLNLAHCQPGTAKVLVFISPAALAWFQQQALQSYLNVWLDGNRDGDWADGVSCGNEPNGGGPEAVEHIVIDQPIDVVALGAGLHSVSVPTGRVPFPAAMAQRPTWVRFTLSEQLSAKPLTFGSIKYGDGRGYATPFHTGETEDYLRHAEGDPDAAPDLGVQLEGRIVAGGGQGGSDQVSFKLGYANLGSGPARGGSLVLSKPAQLRDLEIILLRAPGISPANIVETAETVTIALPDLAPGADGTLVLGWQAPADQQPAGDYLARVEAALAGDSVAENNRAEASLERQRQPPSVAVLAGNATVWGSEEATCRDSAELRGVSIPGATFDLWVDGAIEAALQDLDTSWNYRLEGLSDGRHQIYVAPNGATGPSIRSNLLRLQVDSGLPVDPLSLTFTDSTGVSYHPPTLNWRGLGGAIAAYLRSGETYEVAIDSCINDPNQQIELTLPSGDTITMSDPEDDGRYAGSFIFDESGSIDPESLARTAATSELLRKVRSGGTQHSFSLAVQPLAPGLVRDGLSGEPLAGVSVSALGLQGANFSAWPAAALGKPNPQISDASGRYSFSVPGGVNRLAVTHSGYQPFTSWGSVAQSGLLAQEIRLSPLIAEAASHTVYITAAGFEPALLELPVGSVVEWVNLDLVEHSVSGAGWASGALAMGQSYKARLSTGGNFRFDDVADPLGGGTLLVGAGQAQLFLPLIWR